MGLVLIMRRNVNRSLRSYQLYCRLLEKNLDVVIVVLIIFHPTYQRKISKRKSNYSVGIVIRCVKHRIADKSKMQEGLEWTSAKMGRVGDPSGKLLQQCLFHALPQRTGNGIDAYLCMHAGRGLGGVGWETGRLRRLGPCGAAAVEFAQKLTGNAHVIPVESLMWKRNDAPFSGPSYQLYVHPLFLI
ncbi:hypothetical protein E2562_003317 [Oryza meyeriana var. granulata]|uniref:Uncharacterized protein n=1 Tax=Oryza meyeriana var. granulata TaxID=110450 RepID=A0A6G1EE67_9ORYZ|nr:hypothetical protein E2562_003317 [Oryza meyeriana var. granulata]